MGSRVYAQIFDFRQSDPQLSDKADRILRARARTPYEALICQKDRRGDWVDLSSVPQLLDPSSIPFPPRGLERVLFSKSLA